MARAPGAAALLAALTCCNVGKDVRPGGDASSDASSAIDAQVPTEPGKISVVVAQGGMGRTTISCDDGKTWIRDRSWITEANDLVCNKSTPVRCAGSTSAGTPTACTIKNQSGSCETHSPCDCVHDPGVPHGIAAGNDSIVSVFGLGAPGRVIRTTDALHWTDVYDVSYSTFGGVRFGGGRFVMATETLNVAGLPAHSLSSVDGTAWQRDGIAASTRALAYSGMDRFLIMHENGLRYTTDAGKTWMTPADHVIDCATPMTWAGGGVYGNGILLTLSETGYVCRSTDGGVTWTRAQISNAISSNGIWASNQFMFWTDDFIRHTSPDGQTWTHTPMVTKIKIGQTVQTPSGQFVAANGSGYEEQKIFTSSDGLTWTESTQTAPVADRHFIAGLAVGLVDRTPGCGI